MATLVIHALLWALLVDWQIRSAEYSYNLLMFMLWAGCVIGALGLFFSEDMVSKEMKTASAGVHRIARLSWVTMMLMMASYGRFVLAACMAVGLLGSITVRRTVLEAREKRMAREAE